MPTVLITRPYEVALKTQDDFASAELKSLIDPMLKVSLQENVTLPEAQAYLVTSQHALPVLGEKKNTPLFVVGEATAEKAKKMGHQNVHVAEGNAEDLLALALKNLPQQTKVIHLSGDTVRLCLATELKRCGYEAMRMQVYETEEAQGLSPQTVEALESNALGAITFYSPRTALVFNRLCRQAGLEERCRYAKAFCLSDAIKSVADQMSWQEVVVAPKISGDFLRQYLL